MVKDKISKKTTYLQKKLTTPPLQEYNKFIINSILKYSCRLFIDNQF